MPSFLDDFDAVLKELKAKKPEIVSGLPIPNDAAKTDKLYPTNGSFLYLESIPAGATIAVRLNERTSRQFTLLAGQAIRAPFYRLFITTTGVVATDTELVIGRGDAFEFVDTGDVSITGAGLATQVTLAAILAKIIAAPATEATLASILAEVTPLDTGAVVVATSALPAGAATEASLAKIATYVEADHILVAGVAQTVVRVAFDVNAATFAAVAAVAAKRIYVVGIEFSVDTDATTLKLTENTVGDLHAAQTFMKGGGKVVGDRRTILYKTTTDNKGLDITTAIGKATGSLWYCQF